MIMGKYISVKFTVPNLFYRLIISSNPNKFFEKAVGRNLQSK